MIISLISAIARNGVIGTGGGGIPWELPRDSQHFRAYTKGKWMLLGRRTYQEMDGWFKNQTPIVLSRSKDFEVSNGYRAGSVPEALSLAKDQGCEELVVSGGAGVYGAAMPVVEKLVLTRIDAEIEGGAVFPEVNWDDWDLVESESWPKDNENIYKMTLEVYVLGATLTL